MTGEMIEILVPTIEVKKEQKSPAPRVADLDNKVIGILDNRWEGFVRFLNSFEELLALRYKSSRIIRRSKMDMTAPAPADIIDELATSCHVVINGLGA